MDKHKVSNNKHLPLLSDVLPYELPLHFSNNQFFHFANLDMNNTHDLLKGIYKSRNPLVPYKFKLKVKEKKTRTISLMHPNAQLEACDFYAKYESLILLFCSRSKFSIRYPISRVKYIKTKKKEHIIHGTRFFKYNHFNYLHKFYSSSLFHSLERRFKIIGMTDVSKCFDSIYTHSISWAAKDKEYSKLNIEKVSFEHDFDRVMQTMHFGETNGIIIGPEICRIFAEIILQKIDINVELELLKKGLLFNSDYIISRYLDDFIIFCNNKENLTTIRQSIADQLLEFKMFINESKEAEYSLPYISDISKAKMSLSSKIELFYSELFNEPEEASYKKYVFKNLKNQGQKHALSKGIDLIKSEIGNYNIELQDVSRFTIGIFLNKLKSIVVTKFDDSYVIKIKSHFELILDLIFYTASIDNISQNTIALIRSIEIVKEFYRQHMIHEIPNSEQYFFRKLEKFLTSITYRRKLESVEASNILTALKSCGTSYLLRENILEKLLDIENEKLGYFQIIGVLYYIRNIKIYKNLKTQILEYCYEIFKTKNGLKNAEYFILFHDLIKCPYIERNSKEVIINNVNDSYGKPLLAQQDLNQIYNYVNKHIWFTEWRKPVRELLDDKKQVSEY